MNINEYINGSCPEAKLPVYEAKGEDKIYFPNIASALIYWFELQGQISDGYWENARPNNHWKWVTESEIEIDKDKCGYTGAQHRITYSTEWLRRYVKKALKGQGGDYDWTIRAFNYAKLGSVLTEAEFKKMNDKSDYRSVLEYMPEEPVDQAGLEAKYAISDYRKKYWESVKSFFTDGLLKRYYDSNYGWSEFEDDLELAETAINTPIAE
jgi:hypothetical protein